jgi:hypothetical protein
MHAQVQPHVLTKAAAQGPAATTPAVAGTLGSQPQSLLDSVLGAGVVWWDPHSGGGPTGQAGGAGGPRGAQGGAAALRVDADQMQQYGISQVCGWWNREGGGAGAGLAWLGPSSSRQV